MPQTDRKVNAPGIILVTILLVAVSRLVPHPPNFSPLGAMALFGAVTLSSRWLAIAAPLLALYLSDLVLNNIVYAQYQESFTWAISAATYLGFLAVIGLGFLALRGKGFNAARIAGVTVTGSLLFYVITNFFSWYLDPFNLYADGPVGLLTSYTAALPFLGNSLLGDCFFSFVLFGGYSWYTSRERVYG